MPPPNRYWHYQCAVAYRVARGVQADFYRNAHLRERICEQSGSATGPLELDHRIALSLAHGRGDWRFLLRAYDIRNLHWLCRPCHAAKTGGPPPGQQPGVRQTGGLEPVPTAPSAPPGQQTLPMSAAPE